MRFEHTIFPLKLRGLVLLLMALLGSFLARSSMAATTPWQTTDQAQVRLIASTSPTSGREILAAFHIRLAKGWHIYWRTPGDAGFSPRFDWEGSSNINQPKVSWPAPLRRIDTPSIQSYIYEDEALIPITLPLMDPSLPSELRLHAEYAICSNSCIAAETTLSLNVPSDSVDKEALESITHAFRQVPASFPSSMQVKEARLDGQGLYVTIANSTAFLAPALFVEGPEDLVFGIPSVTLSDQNRVADFTVPLLRGTPKTEIPLTLTLAQAGATQAVEVTTTPVLSHASALPLPSLSIVLVAAWIGGLILNIMPCVLPVLSLKIFGLLRKRDVSVQGLRVHFFATALGIVTSFLLIAVLVIGLQSAGMVVQLGFQFQMPAFIIGMVILLVLFACSVWEVITIPLPSGIASALSQTASKFDHRVWIGPFLSGAFTTLLATPCSAPFVGTAISFAFAHEAQHILLIFLVMGLGLATPYLLLIAFPNAVRFLPKPGKWMSYVKYLLGGCILLTALWLMEVLRHQLGTQAALLVFLCCLLLKCVLQQEKGGLLKGAATCLVIALTFYLPMQTHERHNKQQSRIDALWQPFSEQDIRRHINEGKVVVVDVTADWCLTCKANKVLVLDQEDVLDLLKKPGIVAMRADITSPNPRITEYLSRHHRYGIPFNAVYGPNAKEGIVLPELLSRKNLQDALRQAR